MAGPMVAWSREPLFGTHAACLAECLELSCASTSDPASCCCTPWEAACRVSSVWAPATHAGDLDGAPGPWSQPGPAPIIVASSGNELTDGSSVMLACSARVPLKYITTNASVQGAGFHGVMSGDGTRQRGPPGAAVLGQV